MDPESPFSVEAYERAQEQKAEAKRKMYLALAKKTKHYLAVGSTVASVNALVWVASGWVYWSSITNGSPLQDWWRAPRPAWAIMQAAVTLFILAMNYLDQEQ